MCAHVRFPTDITDPHSTQDAFINRVVSRQSQTTGLVWTANKHTRTKLMTADMEFWRNSARVSRRVKIGNIHTHENK